MEDTVWRAGVTLMLLAGLAFLGPRATAGHESRLAELARAEVGRYLASRASAGPDYRVLDLAWCGLERVCEAGEKVGPEEARGARLRVATSEGNRAVRVYVFDLARATVGGWTIAGVYTEGSASLARDWR